MLLSVVTHQHTGSGICFIFPSAASFASTARHILYFVLSGVCKLVCNCAQYVHHMTISQTYFKQILIRAVTSKRFVTGTPLWIFFELYHRHLFYSQLLYAIVNKRRYYFSITELWLFIQELLCSCAYAIPSCSSIFCCKSVLYSLLDFFTLSKTQFTILGRSSCIDQTFYSTLIAQHFECQVFGTKLAVLI